MQSSLTFLAPLSCYLLQMVNYFLGIENPERTRGKGSLRWHYFDVCRIGTPQGEVVSAHRDVDGIAQGSNFHDADLRTLRDTHIHDATADLAGVVEPLDRARLADFDIIQCHDVPFQK